MDLAHNALEVLNKRYFKKNDQGEIIEDWEGLCHRVTSYVMDIKDTSNPKYKAIYKMLHSRDFLPNSPTLFNAGISGTLSGCFFMKPEDSMISIMKVADHTARILKFGGGVGFNFSSIRPLGSHIKTTHGVSCGTLAVLETYSQIGDMVTQAGKRSAAYMGLLQVDHPDIIDFINIKKKNPKLSNFNISVVITDEFMTALHNGEDIELKFEGKVYGTVSAKSLWQMIISNAHKSGDPGLLFIDRVKEMDPLINTLPIEGCNPCFSGDTEIFVIGDNGEKLVKNLRDLDGQNIKVPSVDSDGYIKIKSAKAFKTRSNAELWRLTLDDGSEIKATPNHQFMLRDGSYKSLEELSLGDSLMPMNLVKEKYWNFYLPKFGRGKYAKLLTEYKTGSFADSKKFHVHHKDGNRYNDFFSNLELQDRHIHQSEAISGDNNPMRKWWPKASEEVRLRYRKNMSEAVTGQCNGMYGKEHSSESKVRICKGNLLRVGNLILNSYGKINNRVKFDELVKTLPIKSQARRYSRSIFKYFNSWDEFYLEVANYNHKVSKIEFCGYEDVYDLNVEDLHNFAIVTSYSEDRYSGVFVHNCGEMILENYGACTLGSINLYHMLDKNNKLSVTKLRNTVYQAVEFLDSTIEQNNFPIPRVSQTVKLSRKIGLGVMGFADMLCTMGIVYGSDESIKIAKEVMERIQFEALSASADLAQKKGTFPEFNYSDMKPIHVFRDRAVDLYAEDSKQACYRAKERWDNLIAQIETHGLRNATVTTIAPTGTIGIIADVSGGIEPQFSLVYKRRAFAGERDLYVVSRFLADHANAWGLNDKDYDLIMKGDLKDCKKLPLDVKETLVSANELSVEEHIGMLAAFQLFTSNAISKTINMPKTASIKDVSNAYLSGYSMGCKGITIYRDGSIKGQVLTTSEESEIDSGYLSAHRIKINTEHGQAFILVSESEGKPVEIFMFPPDKSIQTDREGAYMEALCRIIAVGIQGYDKLSEYEKQLKKSNAKRGNPNPTLTYIKQALKSSKNVDSLTNLPMTDEDKVVIYSIYRSIKLGLSGCSDLNEYLKELKDVNNQHGHVSTTLNFIIRALVSVAEYLDDVGPSRLSAICDKCGADMVPYENCFRCKECNHTKCG